MTSQFLMTSKYDKVLTFILCFNIFQDNNAERENFCIAFVPYYTNEFTYQSNEVLNTRKIIEHNHSKTPSF